jgi:hypothetical protein
MHGDGRGENEVVIPKHLQWLRLEQRNFVDLQSRAAQVATYDMS